MNPKQLLAAFAATLVLTACAFLMPSAPPVVEGRVASFPHDVHVDDEVALDCIECHMDAEDGPMAGMPTLDMCWACHEEATQKDKPLEAQLVGFVLPSDVEATWSTVTRAAIDSNFSHQTHLEAGTDCLDCHIGVDQADQVDWDWHISMDQCINCHEHSDGLAPTDDCKACHQDIDQFTMPANHNGGWGRMQGQPSIDGSGSPHPPSPT
ncbi:MAG: cytochrome c3 family protein [Planctomycetes bacterium]|nr:cytochrome c3 family protein [Planctomycetota bacterium]